MKAAQVVADYDLFIFDLDGTLISGYMDNVDADYHQWKVLKGRLEVLEALAAQGKNIAVATNQGGIDYAFSTPEDWEAKKERVCKALDLGEQQIFVCFATPNGKEHVGKTDILAWDVGRRKPSPVMLNEAMLRFDIPKERTLMIGDMKSDEEAATNAGCDYADAKEFFA